MRRAVTLVALLSTALTMGLEFAHVLQWPQKQHYDPNLYARLQESLYVWYGNVGGIIYLVAVVATVALAVLTRWRYAVAAAVPRRLGWSRFSPSSCRSTPDSRSDRTRSYQVTGPASATAGKSATPSGSPCSRWHS